MGNETLENLMKKIRKTGYVMGSGAIPGGDPTIADRVNIELLYANQKSLEKLKQAIERFNKRSTVLTRWMLIISVLMTVLVGVQVWIMVAK
ncbi:MAG: hypothetical protein ACE5WD_12440 [Candidatus Aminicenantia bacterium]